MKTNINLFCAAALIGAICTGIVACNEPKTPEQKEERKEQNDDLERQVRNKSLSDAYYWLGEEKIPVKRVEGKYFVMFLTENETQFQNALTKVGVKLIGLEDGRDNIGAQGEYKVATIEDDYEKIKVALSHTFYWAPYYRTNIGDGRLTNRFSIALKSAADLSKLEKLAKENSVEILGVSELDGWYELACTNLSTGNSLEMGNLFYETGFFESVGYDLRARGQVN